MEHERDPPTGEVMKVDVPRQPGGLGVCWTAPLSCYTCNEYREDEQQIEHEDPEEKEQPVSTEDTCWRWGRRQIAVQQACHTFYPRARSRVGAGPDRLPVCPLRTFGGFDLLFVEQSIPVTLLSGLCIQVDRAAPLLEGLPGFLMDRHGNSVRCVVKLNKMRTALLLLCGDKGRTVPLQEIRSIFYGDELKRLDAFDADNTACVAVYLVSGSALPIVFPSEDQKFQFLDGVESLQFASTSAAVAPSGDTSPASHASR